MQCQYSRVTMPSLLCFLCHVYTVKPSLLLQVRTGLSLSGKGRGDDCQGEGTSKAAERAVTAEAVLMLVSAAMREAVALSDAILLCYKVIFCVKML